jgi:hypothetical protein
LGVAGGLVYAWVAGVSVVRGMGAAVLTTGICVLALGLLAAVEPPGGWASKNLRSPREGRRSIVARVAQDHPAIGSVTSLDLAAWGAAVGGALIGLGTLALALVR